MVTKHHFNQNELTSLLAQAQIKDDILKKIAKPAESLSWSKYRPIFVNLKRIEAGIEFWQAHETTLNTVAQNYGIPAEIIVAIIGVETSYGKHAGNYRVIDALNTLAFAYPKRSQFFSQELEQFLLLCREQHINPLNPTGSYAGAMGIPQFMPSSYRTYAQDFNGDNYRDIWKNPDDAIASVANYFKQFQWQTGEAIAFTANARNENYKQLLSDDLKPNTTLAQLTALNVSINQTLPNNTAIKLLALDNELWATLPNFYVITRYNHSPLYAMAVFQLSLELKAAHG
jgi:membrane-bound lytic murein transglycosylase B